VRQRSARFCKKCRVARRGYGYTELTGRIGAKSAACAVPRLFAGTNTCDPRPGEHEIGVFGMRRAVPWPVLICKHANDNIFEICRVERAQTVNIILDRIELRKSRISLGRRCRVAAGCWMDIGTGKGMIEKARGGSTRLDSVLACQCKILKAANAEIY